MRGGGGDPGPRGAREAQGPWGGAWPRTVGAVLSSSLSPPTTGWCPQASPEPL